MEDPDNGSFFDGVGSWLHDLSSDVQGAAGAYESVFGDASNSSGSAGPADTGERALAAGKGMGMYLLIGGGLILAYLLWSNRK